MSNLLSALVALKPYRTGGMRVEIDGFTGDLEYFVCESEYAHLFEK
jgi:hypothetical protein